MKYGYGLSIQCLTDGTKSVNFMFFYEEGVDDFTSDEIAFIVIDLARLEITIRPRDEHSFTMAKRWFNHNTLKCSVLSLLSNIWGVYCKIGKN
jgi:hypothetical protein